MDAPLTGVVPVVPTIFLDDQSIDLGGTARVVDYLTDARVDGLRHHVRIGQISDGAGEPRQIRHADRST